MSQYESSGSGSSIKKTLAIKKSKRLGVGNQLFCFLFSDKPVYIYNEDWQTRQIKLSNDYVLSILTRKVVESPDKVYLVELSEYCRTLWILAEYSDIDQAPIDNIVYNNTPRCLETTSTIPDSVILRLCAISGENPLIQLPKGTNRVIEARSEDMAICLSEEIICSPSAVGKREFGVNSSQVLTATIATRNKV